MKKLFTLLLLLNFPVHSAFATNSWNFSSGYEKAQMVELFTSHGCSSCPVAESWMNKLSNHPGLWQSIVPVAFHVSYWNHLGWKDIYSKEAYSERQRAHSHFGNTRSVYTPGFLVDGKEWKGFFYRRPLPQLRESAPKLSVDIINNSLLIKLKGGVDNQQPLIANVAVLGSGLIDNIERGENSGRTLKGDFVVLEHKQSISSSRLWNIVLPENIETHASKKISLAVWVTTQRQVPIQATGAWAPPNWLE